MKTRKTMLRWLTLMVLAGGTVMAGSRLEVLGIQVKMNTPGDAYYDDPAAGGDNTVTIEPWYDYAKINVSAGRDAAFWWGGYCDVFISADDLIVGRIAMKGSRDTSLYVVGQTYHCDQFMGKSTFVGNTDAYGREVGLGMASVDEVGWPWPKRVMLRDGVAYGGVLANVYFGGTKSLDEKLSDDARDMLFQD